MKKNLPRILVALFFVGCGVAPAVFLNLLFGANSRTLAVSAAWVSGVGMLACTVDLALRGSAASADDTNRYQKRMNGLMIVLGIVLISAIGVFINQFEFDCLSRLHWPASPVMTPEEFRQMG